MNNTQQLPACGHWFLDLCPATRTVAEQYARIRILDDLARLENEIEYYRKRRDRVANHYRLQTRSFLRQLLTTLQQPVALRPLFSGGTIDEHVARWLVDPSVCEECTTGHTALSA